jgi:CheY-like chemotaxis protein
MNPTLLLHDYDPDELTATESLLARDHTLAGLEIYATTSRSALLQRISGLDAASRGLALVDLCAEDGHDHEYRGLRIIETIRRHPRLAQRAHPIALTRHARTEILTDLHQAGAVAAIHKRALESNDTAVVSDGLAHLARTPLTPWEARADVQVFPPQPSLAVIGEDEQSVWRNLFGTLHHSDLRRQILLGRAAGIPNRELAGKLIVHEGTIEKTIRDMQDHLAPRYQMGAVPSLLPAAQEFLRRCVQLGPLPADLARLPAPSRIKAWYDDEPIRRDAWLDPEADGELRDALLHPPARWQQSVQNAQAITRGALALLDSASEQN